jgi:membrane-bound ClpP family serine protease
MTMTERRASMQTGALLWIIGTLLVVLEPALILFTIGLAVVGVVAIGAWLLYTFFVLRDARRYQRYSRQPVSK